MSGESREGLVPSWWRNQTFPLSPEEHDLEYFRKNLRRGLRLGHPTKKLEKQIELLEDALVIYREHRTAVELSGGKVIEAAEDFSRRYAAHKLKIPLTPEQIVENEIMMLVEKFGFTEEQARSLAQHDKYLKDIESLKWIPRSLLVQTFMRKLQNGMDRRRP